MRVTILLLSLVVASVVHAQFSPDGGQPGSIAVHKDSIEWIGFATEVELELGWLDAADTSLGRIDFIARDAGLGSPDFNVQPLGDGGHATASFANPIADGPGADFVVFENGFATSDTTGFFELAFVEVSSNGFDFFRFPNTSLSAAEDFSGAFVELDSRLLDGLAGRFSAPYGAPFDLADLPSDALLDKNAVRYVRVVDVVGSSDPAFAKTDDDGMPIIDPYPTAFNTGGFDLDAIGIINSSGVTAVDEVKIYPQLYKSELDKNNKTVVARSGEVFSTATSRSIWMDVSGIVSSRGTFAPSTAGFYFIGEPQHLHEWRRVYVY